MRLCTPTINKCILNNRAFDAFIGDKLGNDLFISDPERAARRHDAAEYGADGSTHAEVIEDWKEFCNQLPERCADKLHKLIDDVERWHDENGSLYTELG